MLTSWFEIFFAGVKDEDGNCRTLILFVGRLIAGTARLDFEGTTV